MRKFTTQIINDLPGLVFLEVLGILAITFAGHFSETARNMSFTDKIIFGFPAGGAAAIALLLGVMLIASIPLGIWSLFTHKKIEDYLKDYLNKHLNIEN